MSFFPDRCTAQRRGRRIWHRNRESMYMGTGAYHIYM
jgi:hypothetical protein